MSKRNPKDRSTKEYPTVDPSGNGIFGAANVPEANGLNAENVRSSGQDAVTMAIVDSGDSGRDAPAEELSDEMLLMEYLDGELDPSARRHIEQRLSREPELRRRLSDMELSWNSLELLDRAAGDKKLAETMLETVIVSAEVAVARRAAGSRKYRFLRIPAILGLLILGVILGNGAASFFFPDPNLFLLTEMPIVERFDEYQTFVGKPELLMQIVEAEIFDKEIAAIAAFAKGNDVKPEPLGQYEFTTLHTPRSELKKRIDGISRLDPVSLARINRNYSRFTALSEEHKWAYRKLNFLIEKSSDPQLVDRTLTAYTQWFRSLPTDEKHVFTGELRTLSTEELLDALRRRVEHSRQTSARKPTISTSPGDVDEFDPSEGPDDAELADFLLNGLSLGDLDRLLSPAPAESLERMETLYHESRKERREPTTTL